MSDVSTYCKDCSCGEYSTREVYYRAGGWAGIYSDDTPNGQLLRSNYWTGEGSSTCACAEYVSTGGNIDGWYIFDVDAGSCKAFGTIDTSTAAQQLVIEWSPPGLFREGYASVADLDGDYAIEDIAITSEDDWGFMEEWDFDVGLVDATTFDDLATGAVGIWFEHIQDEDGEYFDKIYHMTFEHEAPILTFVSEEDTTTTFGAELDSDEEAALEDLYGVTEDDLETLLNTLAATIGEVVALATAEAAHTFKKIRSAEFDENTFDVFEEEEETQTVAVSTTYSSTVTYQ